MFCSDGQNWKFLRHIMNNIFGAKTFRDYIHEVFVLQGKKVVECLEKAADEGTVVNFQVLMLNYSLDCFGA